jgi:PAS domain S-box-containing protein
MPKLRSNNYPKMESLQALFEHSTEGIIISNDKGIIINANPSSERLFAYDRGELKGVKIEELIPPRFAKNHDGHRKSYNDNPHPRSMGKNLTLFALRKDGTEFPVEISLSHYKNNDEMFVISFVIDISERKQHEQNIQRLNLELENKVNERTKVLKEALYELENSKEQLSQALEKEKELNDMKSRFVSMASHEFRTPLSAILSSVSLISKYTSSDTDEKRQKHVTRIKSSVTNMTMILNDFLSADKLEEGKVHSNVSEFLISEMVEEVILDVNGMLKNAQKIEYVKEGENFVCSDKQMIRNILLNLVSNAIKFSAEGKIIKIQTSVNDNTIQIQVIDQGIGIPKEEQENLFGRFFRAKNATNIQGTGLGLNIVGKYLELLNGEISFESELNIGSTFIVKIPNVYPCK